MEIMSLIIMRSLERIVAIGIGCIFVYLGYRLFIKVPTKEDSEGKFTLPRGWGIHLTRVGPGVFFALFGTAIVVMSFLKPISYKEYKEDLATVTTEVTDIVAKEIVEYLGVTSGNFLNISEQERQRQRNLRQRDIAVLNDLPDQLSPNLDARRRTDIKLAIPRIKLAIMETVWDEAYWGDYNQFKVWVLGGAMGTPPDNPKEAFLYFNLKKGGQSK